MAPAKEASTAKQNVEGEPRDLGFGTRVGTSGERLLNRDGSFTVRRTGLGWRATLSLYHTLLTMRWSAFLGLVVVQYLLVNAIFAAAYQACGAHAIQGPGEHGFLRSFFFSVQTISSVGYGHLSPGSLGTNLLMTAESVVGLLGVALATGLVFARFSRPRADIVFSHKALVAPYRDGLGLMFRLANRRRNQISGVEARVMLSLSEARDGATKRRFEELSLERRQITFFPLSWTVVHPIDEESPLFGLDAEDLESGDMEIFVYLTGTDETFSQTVHARTSYRSDEVVWHARFSDIFERSTLGRPTAVDVSRIPRPRSPFLRSDECECRAGQSRRGLAGQGAGQHVRNLGPPHRCSGGTRMSSKTGKSRGLSGCDRATR